ncbi:MAG: hypothetical protein IMF06_10730 [Proteobacteria bacterium]|nr:hypothetical protein [Pseudomonadota bacterium]
MKRRTFCQTTLKQAAVQELSDELRGPLLLPGNPAYDSGRHVLNAAIDKYPAFIVQPGNLIYPIDRLRDILEFYAEFSVNVPDELTTDLIFGYPQGRPGFVVLALCYCGDHAEGTRVMAAVKALGEPMMGEIKPTDYVPFSVAVTAMHPGPRPLT